MTHGLSDNSQNEVGADLIDAFKAPFSEPEKRPENHQTGLILFSFGRNGGFSRPGDNSHKRSSVA